MRKTELKRKTPMKRTGFKKKAILDLLAERIYPKSLSQLKPKKRTPISHRSFEKIQEDREYKKLRERFLMVHPRCQCEDCGYPASQIHHKGRRGLLYLVVKYFLACCSSCHAKIEVNGKWAVANGYTLSIADRNKAIEEQRRLLG